MACGESFPREALTRFVRDEKGRLTPDRDGRAQGRGAYLCGARKCRDSAADGRAFARSFRAPVLVHDEDLD